MDFDADGKLDVVSGSYHPGDLYVFKKQSNETYARPEKIQGANGKPVNVGAAAHAYLVDWDADDDLDLIVGNIQGEVWYVPNEGTREKPAYGDKQALNGTQVKCGGGDAGPAAADWDGDGRLDLLVGGGDGAVTFYRNTSDDKSKPHLAAGQVIVPVSPATRRDPGAAGADPALKHGLRVKLHVVDYNGDGRLDLLLGDYASVESKPELTGDQRARQQEAEAKLEELNAGRQKLAVAPDGETQEQRRARLKADRDVERQITAVTRERKAAARPSRYEPHGYVWLYLRKDAPRTAGAQGGGG